MDEAKRSSSERLNEPHFVDHQYHAPVCATRVIYVCESHSRRWWNWPFFGSISVNVGVYISARALYAPFPTVMGHRDRYSKQWRSCFTDIKYTCGPWMWTIEGYFVNVPQFQLRSILWETTFSCSLWPYKVVHISILARCLNSSHASGQSPCF